MSQAPPLPSFPPPPPTLIKDVHMTDCFELVHPSVPEAEAPNGDVAGTNAEPTEGEEAEDAGAGSYHRTHPCLLESR